MIDFIASLLVRCVVVLFRVVPIGATLWLGRRIGTIAFWINRKRRLVAYANLKAAFSKEKTPAELRRITKGVYQNLIQTVFEILNLAKIDRRYVDTYIKIVRYDRLESAIASGRGVILLTAHFGDWELSSLTSAVIGHPIMVLAREQKMRRLNELLNRLRESKGCRVVRKGLSTKNILRALYDRNIVGILSDQDAGRNGVFVDFFGRPTSTHEGPAAIARKTDSIIIPNFIVRRKGAHHTVFLEEPIDFRKLQGADTVRSALQSFASTLETYVRRYPEQWLWLHKRWKSTPSRTVLVIDDGKAGHLNQSLAAAREIARAWTARGYRETDIRTVVVSVGYRSDARRALLSFLSRFASWRCHGRMWALKACVDRRSYEKLMSCYADFVVSCGSSVAPVNAYLAYENNAKNVVIMKPGFTGYGQFDVAVIPGHDHPPRRRNVVKTVGALNLIDGPTLEACGAKMRERFGPLPETGIGILIGGDSKDHVLPAGTVAGIIDAAVSFARENGVALHVTTSRRTGCVTERIVEDRLKKEPLCKTLVIASHDNPPFAVGGILAVSDLVIVSGESASMVSEAVQSGKKVVVFEAERRRGAAVKHDEMLAAMASRGSVMLAKPGELYAALRNAWKERSSVHPLDDMHAVSAAMKAII